VLLTRLEYFIRANGLRPADIARLAGYARQHLLDIRNGQYEPSRRFILEITRAISSLVNREVLPSQLFERADALLKTQARRLRHAHAAELNVLGALLPLAHEEAWTEQIIDAGIATETAVRYLLVHGDQLTDAKPATAAIVFFTAAQVAARLADTPEELKDSLQANALRGRASALAHLARFDDALTDLRVAAGLFVRARFCAHDAGRVEYTRGMILFKFERFRDAAQATQAARRHFLHATDMRRVAHTDILLGGILFDQGAWEEARAIWLRLDGLLSTLPDRLAHARVWQNLGAVEIKLNHRQDARHWLNRASSQFRALGNATELTRTRWNIATYLATFRDTRRGIAALRRVQRTFDALDLYADAACVGLEIVELLEHAPHGDPDLHAYAQETARVLLQTGVAVSAAHAVAALRRIAVAADRRAIIADVRAALRDAGDPCHTVWKDTGEIEERSDPAAEA
jgi:tetratricopeptide (TPR) repeat protein